MIAQYILYTKKENIYPAYVAKHSSNREKQDCIILQENNYLHY